MNKKVFSITITLFTFLILGILVNIPISSATSDTYSYYIQDDGTVSIDGYEGEGGRVVIPSTLNGRKVTRIGSEYYGSAFNSSLITSVEIPYGVKTIGYNAFGYCENLDTVIIPKSVSYIDDYAFTGCESLQIVKIYNPYCAIESSAFGYSPSQYLTIYADKDSTAQKFASRNDIKFVKMDTHSLTKQNITKATMTANGLVNVICNDCGKIVSSTTINKISSIALSTTSYTYDGKEKKPTVIVKDSAGKQIAASNYTVTYASGRKKVGKYNVKIVFKNNYAGTVNKTFTIKAKALKKSNVKLKDIVHTGKATYPKVTVSGKTLKKGTDYTISKISSNKKIGTANVTLKFKGNYSGTVKTSYKIVPAKVKGLGFKSRDTSSITIKWKKVKGAEGYKVYRWDNKKLDYVYYKSTKSTSMKVKRVRSENSYVDIMIKAYKKVGKKTYNGEAGYYYNCVRPGKMKYYVTCSNIGKARINYQNVNNYKLIQVQICINKSFNDNKYDVRNFYTSVSSYSLYKYDEVYLISNKTYYVRCREYDYDNHSNPIYGSWGATKKIYIQ